MKFSKHLLTTTALLIAGLSPATAQTQADFVPYKEIDLRLPSVPLLVNNPFFSIWSNNDYLNN
ncbi:MAG: DUF4964 domain-containing protein, partial [Duncaniella sp.]|nr:DUF4964 domain-containing protein [Duncaniella sp.]